MKRFSLVFIAVLILLTYTGCPESGVDLSLSSDNGITNFTFEGITGIITITGNDIVITVPNGTDVTGLVATFTTTGVSITVSGTSQVSETTANDFTNSVTYTVTAEDGSTVDFIVTVTFAAAAEGQEFNSTTSPGNSSILTLLESSEALTMIYANDQTSITFPTEIDDSGAATLTTKFWMGETEVTNAVFAAVYQWAYDNSKFSTTVSEPNGLDTTTSKQGGRQLLDLADSNCRVDYDGSDTFSAEAGYESNPVTNVTWYGAVMLCNWLTEMRDGNSDNVVYTGIDTDWLDDETVEDGTKNGYRLPGSDEWEYTARYLGTTIPTEENLASEYIAQSHNGGDLSLTSGYYWTPGDYASGAIADYMNETACQAVAVYPLSNPDPTDEAVVKSLGVGSANNLGLYDMSGNVWEWCFSESTLDSAYRFYRGGNWAHNETYLHVGIVSGSEPYFEFYNLGFRLCRSAD